MGDGKAREWSPVHKVGHYAYTTASYVIEADPERSMVAFELVDDRDGNTYAIERNPEPGREPMRFLVTVVAPPEG